MGNAALAAEMRCEALRAGPLADLRALWQAAKTLQDEAPTPELRAYGELARRELAEVMQRAGLGGAAGSAGGAKNVHMILDKSGSMVGSRIATCVLAAQVAEVVVRALRAHVGVAVVQEGRLLGGAQPGFQRGGTTEARRFPLS
jgi:hypothetical protein